MPKYDKRQFRTYVCKHTYLLKFIDKTLISL
nr:MAG TPA: hypothetical protein [Caudoviricetes sp.]